jgi:hypothetical protein
MTSVLQIFLLNHLSSHLNPATYLVPLNSVILIINVTSCENLKYGSFRCIVFIPSSYYFLFLSSMCSPHSAHNASSRDFTLILKCKAVPVTGRESP